MSCGFLGCKNLLCSLHLPLYGAWALAYWETSASMKQTSDNMCCRCLGCVSLVLVVSLVHSTRGDELVSFNEECREGGTGAI